MQKWTLLLLPFLLSSCLLQSLLAPTPDASLAATQTAQQLLDLSLSSTLTAIPSITPSDPALLQPTAHSLPALHSTPLPTPSGSHDSFISPIDGMRLIYIPAGEFIQGSSKVDRDLETNEVPQRKVYLNDYWISQTQVTNAMFVRCVAAGACQYSASHKTNPRYLDPQFADHPVVYMSWQAAMDYCSWSGGRLPTEAEWEKAARGSAGQKFAWGNTSPAVDQLNANQVIGDTTPVGQFLSGASPYGVLDMGGNVREWVWDWYDPYYYQYAPLNNPIGPNSSEKKVLKGASFSDAYRYSRPANRLAHDPASPGANRGFRCIVP